MVPASPTAVLTSFILTILARRRCTATRHDTKPDGFSSSRGLHSHPPGGFLNMLKSTPQAANNGTASQAIHIDSDNNDVDCNRSEKRLTWTKEEDLKLISAWLNNSNDPIQANFKKNDQYWNGVADLFNKTIPKNRVRSAKQIKDHFGRIKKRVRWFCGNWKGANSLWGSGESDEDVMKKALKSYEEDHKKDGPFAYRHCWEVLSKEPKWEAYLERLEDVEPEKRKFSVDEELEQQFSLDDVRDERPIGGKKAKEQRKKKKKDQTSIIDIEDELHSFLDAQKAANEGRTEMLETQKRVSSEKLESRRLAHLAAKEHKEAVMIETYRSLLMQNTSGMDDNVKVEHVLALRCLRESIFKKMTKGSRLGMVYCMLQMLVAVLPLSMQMGWLLHSTEVHLSTSALRFYHRRLIKCPVNLFSTIFS